MIKYIVSSFIISLVLLSYRSNSQSLSVKPEIKISALDLRIDSLLKAMTLEDKLNQLCNNGFMTTPDVKALKIPGFIMDDGPHGVRFEKASAFPTGMALAATWDKEMAYKTGRAMGEEFWAFGKKQQLGPCIDIIQDPRGGRSAEGGGEDPYLSGKMGAAIACGIQSTPVIATVKHFMIEGRQSTRNTRNELFTDRWLMEHYGYNFRTVIQQAGIFSVMSSYNLLNGFHAAESAYLLDTVLRKRWGFPFYVVSDWGAVHNTKLAILAGNDVCMGSDHYKKDLPGLISSGEVSLTAINAAVKNVLRTKILAGMLDYYPTGDKRIINSTQHQAICLQGARESIVLLKNEGHILPIKKSAIKMIAIIGPNADRGNLNCYGSSETTPPYSISILKGIQNKLGDAKILQSQGCDINSDTEAGFAKALEIAARADVVIFAGGLDETQEGEGYNIGHDRVSGSTELPGKQLKLITELAAVNKNLIVIIQSGGVCTMHPVLKSIKGLVYSFYAGQEAGNAIADVIFGEYNPGGRLPVTMAKGDQQLPEWNDNYTDDCGNGYRWFDEKAQTPDFVFGFGLSYSSFKYSNPVISSHKVLAGTPVKVSVDVQNTGNRGGTEVVQLYLSCKSTKVWMPKKELKGFNRIALGPNEKKTVRFILTAEDFYYWNSVHQNYEVREGSYLIKAGNSSDNLPLQQHIEIIPSSGKPDLVVTRVYTLPRYPRQGDHVTFYALVKNQGNAPVTPKKAFDISFKINKSIVGSACLIEETILPGQIKLIPATFNKWLPGKKGKVYLNTKVDAKNVFIESIENNNLLQSLIEVF